MSGTDLTAKSSIRPRGQGHPRAPSSGSLMFVIRLPKFTSSLERKEVLETRVLGILMLRCDWFRARIGTGILPRYGGNLFGVLVYFTSFELSMV